MTTALKIGLMESRTGPIRAAFSGPASYATGAKMAQLRNRPPWIYSRIALSVNSIFKMSSTIVAIFSDIRNWHEAKCGGRDDSSIITKARDDLNAALQVLLPLQPDKEACANMTP